MIGNKVEILDDHAEEGEGALLPRRLFIDGREILLIAENGIKINAGSYQDPAQVTITFMPSSITVRGDA